ncbi:hypothetical protein AALO_G00283200 [Alosa alosa]|uniref:DUF4795 domain-containing protein n=1 Tax=Alosa alosa TaxID=278164 RepID=A0AAV6FL00_9TELE|nr:hypothetical protein AALO_G00283200 [Alosa alosa]
MGLIQDLMKEIQELKESRDNLKKEVKTLNSQLNKMATSDLADRVTALEQCCHLVGDLEKSMRDMRERIDQYPKPDEMTEFVTWEVLQQTLVGQKQNLVQARPFQPFLLRRTSSAHTMGTLRLAAFDPSAPHDTTAALGLPLVPSTGPAAGTATSDPNMPARLAVPTAPSAHAGTHGPGTGSAGSDDVCLGSRRQAAILPPGALALPAAAAAADEEDDQAGSGVGTPSLAPPAPALPRAPRRPDPAAVGTAAPGSFDPYARGAPYVPEAASGGGGGQGHVLQPSASDGVLQDLEVPLSRVSSGALGYPETLYALQAIGRLGDRLASLEARLTLLEEIKADQARLDELREAVAIMGEKDMPENQLMEEMNHLKDLVETLMGDKEKPLEFGGANTLELTHTLTGDAAEHQLQVQLGHLRSVVKRVENDVFMEGQNSIPRERRERPSSNRALAAGHSRSVPDMMASLLHAASQPERDGSLQPPQGADQGHQGGTCPSCPLDLSRKVSKLFQRYERLQGMVSSMRPHQGGARVHYNNAHLQDADMVSDVQGAVLQLQSECEKLHRTTYHLIEEHSQKQTHIDHLYKSVEVLDEKKADRELVEMEIQIRLVKRKKQLRIGWRNHPKKLRDQPLNRQLVARFHCISCDRPVDMVTPGPNVVHFHPLLVCTCTNPTRRYTVFELEQIRQHCRSLRPGTNQGHFEMACMERNLVQVQRMHTHLCQQLERAQSQLASPPTCRYHNTLTPLPRTWTTHTPPIKVERIPEVVEAVAEDEESISTLRIQPEEVDILGLDGHIYKGRLNTLSSRPIKSLEQRLPVINPKEGKGTMKHKLTVSPKNAGDLGRVTPIRPQSAKTQRCRSASSTTTKDRPLSSIGCGSRDTDQPQRPLQLTVISPNQRTSR